jgi:hypothetical protein
VEYAWKHGSSVVGGWKERCVRPTTRRSVAFVFALARKRIDDATAEIRCEPRQRHAVLVNTQKPHYWGRPCTEREMVHCFRASSTGALVQKIRTFGGNCHPTMPRAVRPLTCEPNHSLGPRVIHAIRAVSSPPRVSKPTCVTRAFWKDLQRAKRLTDKRPHLYLGLPVMQQVESASKKCPHPPPPFPFWYI